MKPSAILIGASSGIGLELCRHLASENYRIGIAARRKPLLDEVAASLAQICHVSEIDAARPDEAIQRFKSMMEAVAPVDFVYICAGTGHPNPDLRWELEDRTIRVNALGFAALASTAMSYLLKQGHGHLVGITSVAAVRGSSEAPAYGATKAFESHYLESLRIRACKSGFRIWVTEIRPGFVNTAMMKAEKPFWVASPVVAARQIIAAVEARKSVAYVTARWRLVAWLMRMLPSMIYDRVA